MNSSPDNGRGPALAVGAVVALLLVGVLVAFLIARTDEPTFNGTVEAPPPPADADVDTRLAWLETEVTRLRRDLRDLRDLRERPTRRGNRAAPARLAAGFSAEADDGAESAPPDEARRALMEALSDYDPEMRDQLRAVLQEEGERLREERWSNRMQRRQQRRIEAVEQFAAAAKLTPQQTDNLTTLVTLEMEAMGELFRAAREEGNFHEAREQAQSLRGETDTKAHEELNAEQTEAWDAMRAEERGPGRGPGGGGGRGRGGRP